MDRNVGVFRWRRNCTVDGHGDSGQSHKERAVRRERINGPIRGTTQIGVQSLSEATPRAGICRL